MVQKSILFVCLGNICRSPAAEGVMQKMVEGAGLSDYITVDSAGTASYHTGQLPDYRMRMHGQSRGYLFNSRARTFRRRDFELFDLIIVMDDSNYSDVAALAPDKESRCKIRKMASFLTDKRFSHIPDPYYGGADAFELVLDLLEEACAALLEKIRNNKI